MSKGNEIALDKKPRKKLWALGAGIAVILLLVGALMITYQPVNPQDSGSTLKLGLKYTAGEHMVYNSTSGGVITLGVLGFDRTIYSLDVDNLGPYPETGGYYTSPTTIPQLGNC